jgi:hypothetical protein
MEARYWKWTAALGVAGLAFLYSFAPEKYAFYPQCPFFVLTGLACPGCGTLRALHELLHGNLSAAFHLNSLLIVLLPVLSLAAVVYFTNPFRAREVLMRPVWLWALIGIGIVFGIVRNLPGWKP